MAAVIWKSNMRQFAKFYQNRPNGFEVIAIFSRASRTLSKAQFL